MLNSKDVAFPGTWQRAAKPEGGCRVSQRGEEPQKHRQGLGESRAQGRETQQTFRGVGGWTRAACGWASLVPCSPCSYQAPESAL